MSRRETKYTNGIYEGIDSEQQTERETAVEYLTPQELLPIFTMAYRSRIARLDDLRQQSAETQDKAKRIERKLDVMNERKKRLEVTNEMISELIDLGKLPKAAGKIIAANDALKKSITDNRIPKLEKSGEKAANKIAKLDKRIEIAELKAEEIRCFNNVLRSFTVLNPQKRREIFRDSMDGLQKSCMSLLEIEKDSKNEKLKKLSNLYEEADSMMDKYDLGKKIDAVKKDLAAVEKKIGKLEKSARIRKADDKQIDRNIVQTKREIENTAFITENGINEDKSIESVAVASAEYISDPVKSDDRKNSNAVGMTSGTSKTDRAGKTNANNAAFANVENPLPVDYVHTEDPFLDELRRYFPEENFGEPPLDLTSGAGIGRK